MKSKILDKKAFTLAEVLITLGIIGVVAAMTIPTLINGINDMQYKTAYKKAYSAASQALMNANKDDLMLTNSAGNYVPNFITLMNQFKITKECTSSNISQCWKSGGEETGNNRPSGDINNPAFIDSSGMSWALYWQGQDQIFVDTNGFKAPNQWGKDRFGFSVPGATDTNIPNKIIPMNDNFNWFCGDMGSGIPPNNCVTKQNYYGTSWLYN